MRRLRALERAARRRPAPRRHRRAARRLERAHRAPRLGRRGARGARVARAELDRALADRRGARARRRATSRAAPSAPTRRSTSSEEPLDARRGRRRRGALGRGAAGRREPSSSRHAARASACPLAADASQVLTNVLLNALAWAPPDEPGDHRLEADAARRRVTRATTRARASRRRRRRASSTARPRREGGAGVGLRHARAVARAAGGELELVSRPGARAARGSACAGRASSPRCRARRSRRRAPPCSRARASSSSRTTSTSRRCSSPRSARAAPRSSSRAPPPSSRSARSEEHDAALVDLSPIADDVRGAVEALRRGSPDLALVFISGSAAGSPRSLEGEAVRWVRKPFEVERDRRRDHRQRAEI